MPHPATLIFLWMSLAIVVQTLQAALLPAFALMLVLVAFKMHARRFFALMRRSRWILFSLLLVYAFATPGQELWSLPYGISPTREGLLDGVTQLGRLVCVLAGLSILLTLLSREQLISGLYALSFPARYIGLPRERIAVRLALTLHYAESAMRDTASDWRDAIRRAIEPGVAENSAVELRVQPFARLDFLLLALSGLLLARMWL